MSSWQRSVQEAAPYLSLGMQLALTMVAFVVLGFFLDRVLNTTPWLLLIGAVAGVACMIVRLVVIAGQGRK